MGSEQRAISNRLKLPSFAKEKQIKTTTTEHIEKMQIGGGDRGTLENKLQQETTEHMQMLNDTREYLRNL
jgi:hypothetical protein